jgi:hypothetical protein
MKIVHIEADLRILKLQVYCSLCFLVHELLSYGTEQ